MAMPTILLLYAATLCCTATPHHLNFGFYCLWQKYNPLTHQLTHTWQWPKFVLCCTVTGCMYTPNLELDLHTVYGYALYLADHIHTCIHTRAHNTYSAFTLAIWLEPGRFASIRSSMQCKRDPNRYRSIRMGPHHQFGFTRINPIAGANGSVSSGD